MRKFIAFAFFLLASIGGASAQCVGGVNGTVQTPSYLLQNEFQDNRPPGSITPSCYRDLIATTTLGTFNTTAAGQIIGPNGRPFIPRGINIADWAAIQPVSSSASNNGLFLLQLFPGTNFVRVAMQNTGGLTHSNGNDDPAQFATFVANMTAAGVVVEFVDFLYSNAGSTVLPPTGANLTAEEAWYASFATMYGKNPYVWYGTGNEMLGSGATGGTQIMAEHAGVYAAIRATGYTGPIVHNPPAGIAPTWTGTTFGGTGFYSSNTLTATQYASETNIIWDLHYYGWINSLNTSYNVGLTTVNGQQSAIEAFAVSANGQIPVFFGEYGDSTGGAVVDVNGTQTVMAAQAAGYGALAWGWGFGASDMLFAGTFSSTGTYTGLSSYGQEVASWIAGAPTIAAGAPYMDQAVNVTASSTFGLVFNHVPIPTFTGTYQPLQINIRDQTTGTNYAVSFMYVIDHEGSTPTISTSAKDFEIGTAGYIAFSGGTIQLSWGSVAADGSQYVLSIHNTSANTISAWAGPTYVGTPGYSMTGTLGP